MTIQSSAANLVQIIECGGSPEDIDNATQILVAELCGWVGLRTLDSKTALLYVAALILQKDHDAQ